MMGEYVLATKFYDTSPSDPFEVGYVKSVSRIGNSTRFVIMDGDGNVRRPVGYGHVVRISARRGKWIVDRIAEIERSGKSLKWWLRQPMEVTA